ncbi:MAG: hypothetical protein HYZ53_28970 [Planctomycetes bacterium]|nr:hypothetical protein [Planctomycetota bacterium]
MKSPCLRVSVVSGYNHLTPRRTPKIEQDGRYTPIEVKWTDHPSRADARHLLTFLDEHPRAAPHGFVICRTPAPLALEKRVTALPWFCL